MAIILLSLQGGNWGFNSLQARLLTSTIYVIFSNPSWLAQSSLGLDSCLPTPHPGLLGRRTIRLSREWHLSAPAHRSRAPLLWACILPSPLRPTRHMLPEAARNGGRAPFCRPWVTTRHCAFTHHGWLAGAQESSTSKVGSPGRERPEDLSILQGPLAHELLIYWKKGVWDLSSWEQKNEGKEAPLGLWQGTRVMHSRTQEPLPSLGTPTKAKNCSTGLSS